MSDITKVICQEQMIIDKLESKYLIIKRLFDEKPNQTLAKLKSAGALYTKIFKQTIAVNHNSNEDNVKAWDDYLSAIESYLANICNKMSLKDPHDGTEYNLYEHLRPARKVLAKEIQTQHYNIYNYWPEEGESQESDVELYINGAYKSGNNFYIIWSCISWIKVKDYVSTGNNYNTSFDGKPNIKLVIFNYEKLQTLEISTNKNYEKALESLVGAICIILEKTKQGPTKKEKLKETT
ncbi:17679_t:CDS:2 [Cetraspora pellucida]|uniref:17679_t:CDS:1 n=1 Tax=Cetraspora pellucida TaxID=1433469 RepID=A0A9N9JPU0_9GLOM|nr:17679_t:CDS:2 [Cetraspora pellucida]